MQRWPGWTALPTELLSAIHGFLSIREHCVCCRAVCSQWRDSRARWPTAELVNEEQLAAVLRSADVCWLQALSFQFGAAMSSGGVRIVAGLVALRFLRMDFPQLTDDMLTHLRTLRALEHLELGDCTQVSDLGLKYVSKLVSLRRLCLKFCQKLTGAGLRHLAALDLQELDLYDCVVSRIGAQSWAVLSRLRRLELCWCDVSDIDLQSFSLSLFNLQQLNLSYCSAITSAGLQHLSQLPLQQLTLRSCEVSDVGLRHVAALLNLHKLDLAQCRQVTDEGLQHLKPLTKLQQLDLSGCHVADAGLQHLTPLLSLQELNLSYCNNMTDSGLQHLGELLNLQHLHLCCCKKVTDTGLLHLRLLVNLDQLYLSQCENVTDDGLQRFVEHLGTTNYK